MYRDEGLVLQAERYRTGANTHWLTGTLHRYWNSGVLKYKHNYPTGSQDKYETFLRTFISNKGVGRAMTDSGEEF